jgi:hypothetical protein
MDDVVRQHRPLGDLRWDDRLKCWEADVEIATGVRVALCLSAEKEYQVFAAPEELFAAGAEYLAWARQAEPHCRQQIADDLLECYNEVWANTDPDDADDGPGPMTREEFISRIRLGAIHLDTNGSGVWYYDDQDLFAGHVIEIWVSKDRVFSGAHLAG